jgi:hypothetical protein
LCVLGLHALKVLHISSASIDVNDYRWGNCFTALEIADIVATPGFGYSIGDIKS